jgi:subtilisin family serine protease
VPAALVLTAGLSLGALAPGVPAAPAAAAVSAGHRSLSATWSPARGLGWDADRRSLHVRASDVVAEVGPNEPARVVSVRSVRGRPVVRVVPVMGRAAAAAMVADLQDDPAAVSVGLDSRVQLASSGTSVAGAASASNDPKLSQQWWLTRLRAPSLWAAAPTGGSTVAVVDTGVDASHDDLAGAVLPGADFVTGSGDGRFDGHGHGTHVAGIVGALTNNGVGVASLAPGTKVLPVRVLDSSGSGYDSDVASGIVYAVDHGARVVNLSLGGPASGPTATAVRYATDHDVLVVAAAGNARQSGNPVSYPAAYPDVTAVAASDSADRTATFSNTGPYVDVTAPGVGIVSTYPAGRYASLSGTSMATPVVAAAAAVVRAARPDLTARQVAALLEATATDLAAPGRDDESGSGLVEPVTALCSVADCSGSAPAPAPSPAPAPAPSPPVTATPPASTSPAPAARATEVHLLRRATMRRYGSRTTVAARLVDGVTGAALPGRVVRVCVQVAPDYTASCFARTTDFSGEVRKRLTLRAHTTVTVRFGGTATLAASTSQRLRYTVTSRAVLTRSGRTLSVEVAPATRARVTLQRRDGSSWRRVTVRRTSLFGAKTFTGLRTGTYRVRVPSTEALASAVSRRVRLR